MTFKMELDKFMKQIWTEWYGCFQGEEFDDVVVFSVSVFECLALFQS